MDPRLEDEDDFILSDIPHLEFKDDEFLVSYKIPKEGTAERLDFSAAGFIKENEIFNLLTLIKHLKENILTNRDAELYKERR